MKGPILASLVAAFSAATLSACGDVASDVSPAATLRNGPPVGRGDSIGGQFAVLSFRDASVEVFDANANGNVAPLRRIRGSATRLVNPHALAFDSQGRVYVSSRHTVQIFGSRANGNVAPVATITGSATGFDNQPSGLFVDSSGSLYVVLGGVAGNPPQVEVFAPGSRGNVAPIEVIKGSLTELRTPDAVAVGSDGKIYVANTPPMVGASITTYPPGANGDIPPIARIHGNQTHFGGDIGGLSLDSFRDIYTVHRDAGEVLGFAAGSNGNVAPSIDITGPNTQLNSPTYVAIGPDGRIYVTDAGSQYGSVEIFPPGSTGNASPSAVIRGSSTLLESPEVVAFPQ